MTEMVKWGMWRLQLAQSLHNKHQLPPCLSGRPAGRLPSEKNKMNSGEESIFFFCFPLANHATAYLRLLPTNTHHSFPILFPNPIWNALAITCSGKLEKENLAVGMRGGGEAEVEQEPRMLYTWGEWREDTSSGRGWGLTFWLCTKKPKEKKGKWVESFVDSLF